MSDTSKDTRPAETPAGVGSAASPDGQRALPPLSIMAGPPAVPATPHMLSSLKTGDVTIKVPKAQKSHGGISAGPAAPPVAASLEKVMPQIRAIWQDGSALAQGWEKHRTRRSALLERAAAVAAQLISDPGITRPDLLALCQITSIRPPRSTEADLALIAARVVLGAALRHANSDRTVADAASELVERGHVHDASSYLKMNHGVTGMAKLWRKRQMDIACKDAGYSAGPRRDMAIPVTASVASLIARSRGKCLAVLLDVDNDGLPRIREVSEIASGPGDRPNVSLQAGPDGMVGLPAARSSSLEYRGEASIKQAAVLPDYDDEVRNIARAHCLEPGQPLPLRSPEVLLPAIKQLKEWVPNHSEVNVGRSARTLIWLVHDAHDEKMEVPTALVVMAEMARLPLTVRDYGGTAPRMSAYLLGAGNVVGPSEGGQHDPDVSGAGLFRTELNPSGPTIVRARASCLDGLPNSAGETQLEGDGVGFVLGVTSETKSIAEAVRVIGRIRERRPCARIWVADFSHQKLHDLPYKELIDKMTQQDVRRLHFYDLRYTLSLPVLADLRIDYMASVCGEDLFSLCGSRASAYRHEEWLQNRAESTAAALLPVLGWLFGAADVTTGELHRGGEPDCRSTPA